MNKNLNLKLNLDLKTILPLLRKGQPYLIGLALVAAFGYTAHVVNQALNVQAGEAPAVTATSIGFDQKTIDSLKNLNNVSGQIATPALGKTDPFGN